MAHFYENSFHFVNEHGFIITDNCLDLVVYTIMKLISVRFSMSAVVSSYPDSSQSSIEDSNLSLAMNSYGSLVSLMRSMVGSEMQYKKCKETSHVIQFSIDEASQLKEYASCG